MPDFVTDSDDRSTIERALSALRAQDAATAAALLRPLAQTTPEGFPWTALANAEILLENFDAAEALLDRRLASAPRDIAALLQRGWLHERAGNARAAVSFYTTARNQAALPGQAAPQLARLLEHAARYCEKAGDEFSARLEEAICGGSLSSTMMEALGLLRGEREIDLQQPSVFYYPGLAQRRFFDPAEMPWMQRMLDLLPAMQAELAAMTDGRGEGFSPYVQTPPNRPALDHPLLDNPAWSALYFWRNGEIVAENARLCPATMEALSYAPMPQVPGRSPNAHWSRLLPGAHIVPHTGMLNTRLICHIPIRTAPGCSLRVGSETRGWEPGVPLIFDDSMEHEARNTGPEERVILLFEIWRPEIPEADRATIARIFEVIGDTGL